MNPERTIKARLDRLPVGREAFCRRMIHSLMQQAAHPITDCPEVEVRELEAEIAYWMEELNKHEIEDRLQDWRAQGIVK